MASAGSSSRSVPTVPIVDVGCCPSKNRIRGINKELQDVQTSIYDNCLDKERLQTKEETLKQEVQRLQEEMAEMKKAMKEKDEKIENALREQLEADGYKQAGDIVGKAMKAVGGRIGF